MSNTPGTGVTAGSRPSGSKTKYCDKLIDPLTGGLFTTLGKVGNPNLPNKSLYKAVGAQGFHESQSFP